VSFMQLLHRRRTPAPPPSLTTTVDITTLPDATISPAERAWDAYRSIRNNPGCWSQTTFGTQRRDGRVVGCFAHHLVRRAGYDAVAPHPDSHYRDRVSTGALRQADNPRLVELAHKYHHIGRVPMEKVAAALLELSTYAAAEMFCGGNNLAGLRVLLEERYGPEPVHP
jgi:hypothetical protein